MGDYCLEFQRRAQEVIDARIRDRYHRIETPEVGDVLTTRTAGGVKALVCEVKSITACLAYGDRVRITSGRRGFKLMWGIPTNGIEAVFSFDNMGRECFVTSAGRSLPLPQLNRRVKVTVLSLIEKKFAEPEYDETAVRETLAQTTACVA